MEFTEHDLSLLFGASREAVAVLRSGEAVYVNAACRQLLGLVPLSAVLAALDEVPSGDFALSCTVSGRSLHLAGQPMGQWVLLRLYPGESRPTVPPEVVAELRELLLSLQLTTSRLLDTLSDSDNDLYGTSVRRSSFALANFTERLGDLSQIAEGGIVIFPQLMDLSQLYGDLLYALQLVLPKKYALPTFISEGDCYVNADPRRIEELLLYLLANALCSTPADGSIRIRLRGERESIHILVEDTGCGMEPAVLSSLFDSGKDPWNTTGRLSLGLTLAAAIAAAHGGRLLAESRSGQGTRIAVSLPAVQDPELPVAECIPAEGMGILQRTLAELLDLNAYRDAFSS